MNSPTDTMSAYPVRTRRALYLILIAPFWIVGARAQDISLRIATETGRTQFRVGEQIGLTLTFETAETSSPDKWVVAVNGRDRSVLGLANDRFLVLPQTGASDPLSYRLGEGVVYSGPGGMYLRGKTNVAHLDLNQWVRFERPGNYLVRALFHATASHGRDAPLHSNELPIEIVAGGAAWQSDEIRDDVAILNAGPPKPDSETFEARMNAARRLSYLDTADSVFEAARLLGTADVQVGQILQTWLQATRSRDVAVAAMRQLLRSADQPVTPSFLDTLAALESWRRIPPANPPSVPETRRRYEIRAALVEQFRIDLAAAIDRKHGAARAISLKTLLDNMPPETVPARLRSEIAALFAELPAAQQSELLNDQWKKIAGPGMIPVLRRICDSAPRTNDAAPAIVATAVERLYELDPGQTRQLLLDEMSRPRPRLPFRTLAILPDTTLPHIDKTLLEHLERDRAGEAEELIARYATSGILDGVKTFYRKRDTEMRSRTSANVADIASPACDPPLVAYFLRVDPAWGVQVLQGLLGERSYPGGRCWMSIIGRTAAYSDTPEWEKIAIAALQDSTVAVKADAVKALGRHGSPASESALWESFRYWHEWWKDRPADLNEENRRFERVFLEATAHPGNWTVTSEDFERIRDLCISQGCKAQAEQYRNARK